MQHKKVSNVRSAAREFSDPFDLIVSSKFSRLEKFLGSIIHMTWRTIRKPNVKCLGCRKFSTIINVKRKLWDSPQGHFDLLWYLFGFVWSFSHFFVAVTHLGMAADDLKFCQFLGALLTLICKNWIWLSIKSWPMPQRPCVGVFFLHFSLASAFPGGDPGGWTAAEAAKAINRWREFGRNFPATTS